MKKSADIINLPVIGIKEGVEIGTVKDFVINPVDGVVAALVIDDGKWYLGAKLLPFGSVLGLGEYAITIENSKNICDVATAPEFENLLIDNVKVIGTKVLTKTGQIKGTVSEILIDTSGRITACEITENNGEISHIPSQKIVTFGKEVLIVSDSEVNEETVAAATITAKPSDRLMNAIGERQTDKIDNDVVASTPNRETSTDETARKFDEKHRKFLLGKKANRRIETDNGMIIVEQGGEITEEVLQKAKLAGKFVELSMSIS